MGRAWISNPFAANLTRLGDIANKTFKLGVLVTIWAFFYDRIFQIVNIVSVICYWLTKVTKHNLVDSVLQHIYYNRKNITLNGSEQSIGTQ